MRLDDVCEAFRHLRFPGAREQAHPDRGLVLAARSAVAAAVIDDEFLADCISAELRQFQKNRLRYSLTPFLTVPELGIRFAFGYWPPGVTAGAHEHTAWTITAVCRNELEVLTYNREESYRRRELVAKNRFQAPAGRTGFIFEPCIHEPRNRSRDWSLSLHVSSPRDGDCLFDHEAPLPALDRKDGFPRLEEAHPYTSVLVARQRNGFVHQIARIVAAMDVPGAPALLAKCSELGSSATRRLIRQKSRAFRSTHPADAPQVLVRTHKDLAISHRCVGDTVSLEVETPNGLSEEFAINRLAREAMAFVAREPMFEVRAIPGDFSAHERTGLAEALEDSGLFKRLAQ